MTISPSSAYREVQWIVSATAGKGTHTTIAAALAAASSGDQILIRPGTYNENLTLVGGVDLLGLPSSEENPNVTINGEISYSSSTNSTLSSLNLTNSSSPAISMSGSAGLLTINDCNVTTSGANTITASGGTFNVYNSLINCTNASFTPINLTAGEHFFYYSFIYSTTPASQVIVNTGLSCFFKYCYSSAAFLIEGTGTYTYFDFCYLEPLTTTAITSNTTGGTLVRNSIFNLDAPIAVTVGVGSTALVTNCTVNSNAAGGAAFTGAGAIEYGGCIFAGSAIATSVTSETYFPLTVKQGGTAASTFNTNGAVISGTSSTAALAAVSLSAQQFLAGNSGAPTAKALSVAIQTFTSTTTYTPTAGMVYCIIEALGGGGAGGGGAITGANTISVGAGGGSGEYARGVFSAATVGASQSVTIGAAGTPASGTTGGNGGNTSVGALISADGGSGGPVGTFGGTSYAAGGLGGTGGSGGSFRTPGQAGGYALGYFAGSFVPSGQGGNSQYGAGGLTTSNSASGNAGLGYGAGGGGASNFNNVAATTSGGAGTKGLVVVTEYVIS